MTRIDFERRVLTTEFETRSEGNALSIEGYALKFGERSGNLGGFRERVAEGATTKTIKESDIRALFNHDKSLILGRRTAGTLELSNDESGTYYRIKADTRQSYVQDLAIAMERGDVTQSSFGFRVVGPEGDEWAEDEDGYPLRTLREIQLFDVSPVTYPAYDTSTSGLGKRALERFAETRGLPLDEVEADLISAIRGKAPEPDPVWDSTPGIVKASLFEADALALRARMQGI